MTLGLTEDGWYRVGRKLGRTVYWQYGEDGDDTDRFLGIFDEVDIAAMVVDVLNRELAAERQVEKLELW